MADKIGVVSTICFYILFWNLVLGATATHTTFCVHGLSWFSQQFEEKRDLSWIFVMGRPKAHCVSAGLEQGDQKIRSRKSQTLLFLQLANLVAVYS